MAQGDRAVVRVYAGGIAEPTSAEKDITRIATAVDCYPVAFEDNTFDPAPLHERLGDLRARATLLNARRDQLVEPLATAPSDLLHVCTPAQRKPS